MRITTLVVLSALCAVASPAPAQVASPSTLQRDVEVLLSNMVSAFKSDPATVATFYTDDATIIGGGARVAGREQIDQYWRDATIFADWKLEVIDVGGDGSTPWVRGKSTLLGKSGRTMVTEFIGLLKRQPGGELKFYVDMYVAASPGMRRPPGS
jgi:ketosteroid isomerase-like protein